jgi:Ribbon-helix-helix protein, copG family
MLKPPVERKNRFTMMLSKDELKRIQKLSKLLGESASAVVRAAVRKEYHTKITLKRQ